MNELYAGWAKQQLTLPARYTMAGYIARTGTSQGTIDPLYVRALVFKHGNLRIALLIADLLLISPVWAARLQKKIARAMHTSAHNVIVAATHTHSGPLTDATPFQLSNHLPNERTRHFMQMLDSQFVRTAITASKSLRTVTVSYTRCPIRNLATDRNNSKKNRVQPFLMVQLDAGGARAVLGVLPCHPTILGADNHYYSGDLHGEIARRYEQQFDVALIANGATANISTRFTRRSQTRAQVLRSALLVMRQVQAKSFQTCTPCTVSILSHLLQLPIRDFRQQPIDRNGRTGRLAEVAGEGMRVAMQLSKTRAFRRKSAPVPVTLLRLGPICLAALPLELYTETSKFLWSKAKTIPLCYANGYWGYVFGPGARKSDYEVISSPFDSRADKLLRQAILTLRSKTEPTS